MPASTKLSLGTLGASIGITVLAFMIWTVALATLSDLKGSDAAGNGLAQAYGAIEIVLLWLLLAILTAIAAIKGAIPLTAGAPALILIPASAVVALTALGLLSEPRVAPFLWPIIIPALIPPLVVAFAFWALIPALRAAIPPWIATLAAWLPTLLLCLAIAPMLQLRHAAQQREGAAAQKYNVDLSNLPADAPLWDWVPFLATPNNIQGEAVLQHIRNLERRQSDAEIMLDRGDFPLGYLGQMDLDPTPAICEKARSQLRRQVEPLVLKTPNSKPYTAIAAAVADAVAAMQWLVGYGCNCDAESRAWETMAKAYRDTNFDVVELARLREPKELGQILRQDPAHFAMLTPAAHLKAWLKFAGDKEFHDRALAGARTLDHRTADAVEMLNDNEYAARAVMGYLPELDLDATPPLCASALKEQFRELAPVYRPRPDDPRTYRELLERLGGDGAFAALLWLAGHGCDADGELKQAEELVRSYQDSPKRAAVLIAFEQARRKP
jgi:hypothetical protein